MGIGSSVPVVDAKIQVLQTNETIVNGAIAKLAVYFAISESELVEDLLAVMLTNTKNVKNATDQLLSLHIENQRHSSYKAMLVLMSASTQRPVTERTVYLCESERKVKIHKNQNGVLSVSQGVAATLGQFKDNVNVDQRWLGNPFDTLRAATKNVDTNFFTQSYAVDQAPSWIDKITNTQELATVADIWAWRRIIVPVNYQDAKYDESYICFDALKAMVNPLPLNPSSTVIRLMNKSETVEVSGMVYVASLQKELKAIDDHLESMKKAQQDK